MGIVAAGIGQHEHLFVEPFQQPRLFQGLPVIRIDIHPIPAQPAEKRTAAPSLPQFLHQGRPFVQWDIYRDGRRFDQLKAPGRRGKGKKTIEEVPDQLRAAVREILENSKNGAEGL